MLEELEASDAVWEEHYAVSAEDEALLERVPRAGSWAVPRHKNNAVLIEKLERLRARGFLFYPGALSGALFRGASVMNPVVFSLSSFGHEFLLLRNDPVFVLRRACALAEKGTCEP